MTIRVLRDVLPSMKDRMIEYAEGVGWRNQVGSCTANDRPPAMGARVGFRLYDALPGLSERVPDFEDHAVSART